MMLFLRNTIFFNHYCAFIQEKTLAHGGTKSRSGFKIMNVL
jgi:hypothetical protein